MGEKLFAVPWEALKLDTTNKRFELDVKKERLEGAPGFDKNKWPDMADRFWEEGICLLRHEALQRATARLRTSPAGGTDPG